MSVRFDGRVAIVTGAGNGLGRSHALALAERGAKVVVNDLGGDRHGAGQSSAAAQEVVALIKQSGGDAIANGANVANYEQVQAMVAETMSQWGRVDVLINNAGILRDKTLTKMSIDDFDSVVDVHLLGSAYCTKAVWDIMKEQVYGRVVMTTSGSGLYGNFGQSNYAAAKMAVVGLMNALVLEGEKYNIKVNCLAPAAFTRMTEDIMPDKRVADMMTPAAVTAGLLTLCHDEAPTRFILCAGAGGYASTRIYETDGIFLHPADQTPENIIANWDKISDETGQRVMTNAGQQIQKFFKKSHQ